VRENSADNHRLFLGFGALPRQRVKIAFLPTLNSPTLPIAHLQSSTEHRSCHYRIGIFRNMPAEYNLEAPPKEVGETIHADCVHAVSVTLPTWDSNVAYEEGKEWVLSKLKTGYPRYLPLR
jgi:hypothetical protein